MDVVFEAIEALEINTSGSTDWVLMVNLSESMFSTIDVMFGEDTPAS
jgi:hypothetical protein